MNGRIERRRVPAPGAAWPAAILALVLLAGATIAFAGSSPQRNSCEECHSNPDFLVQNKKLYDYYQEWSASVHRMEDVACDDCHGGNPNATTKEEAHGKGVGAADAASGIYYRNVPETCGSCHSDIFEGFVESHHYLHLSKTAEADQGPTCVTCHGSINTEVLNVNSVAAACARCHNEYSRNHPTIPEEAHDILNRFLSIHRFYRYIGIHAEEGEAREFFEELDPQLDQLSVTWHTFVLEEIEEGTQEILNAMKAKRDEIRARRSQQNGKE